MAKKGTGILQFIHYSLQDIRHSLYDIYMFTSNLNEKLFGRWIIRVILLKILNQRAKLGDLAQHGINMFRKDVLCPGSLPSWPM